MPQLLNHLFLRLNLSLQLNVLIPYPTHLLFQILLLLESLLFVLWFVQPLFQDLHVLLAVFQLLHQLRDLQLLIIKLLDQLVLRLPHLLQHLRRILQVLLQLLHFSSQSSVLSPQLFRFTRHSRFLLPRFLALLRLPFSLLQRLLQTAAEEIPASRQLARQLAHLLVVRVHLPQHALQLPLHALPELLISALLVPAQRPQRRELPLHRLDSVLVLLVQFHLHLAYVLNLLIELQVLVRQLLDHLSMRVLFAHYLGELEQFRVVLLLHLDLLLLLPQLFSSPLNFLSLFLDLPLRLLLLLPELVVCFDPNLSSRLPFQLEQAPHIEHLLEAG